MQEDTIKRVNKFKNSKVIQNYLDGRNSLLWTKKGRADAIKETSMNAKNIDMSPRTANAPTIDAGGMKFKVVGGDDSSSLKFKIRNK